MKAGLIPSIGMSLVSIGSAGCATLSQVRAYGECNSRMSGGGECKIGAEVKWEGGGNKKDLISTLLGSPDEIVDAASFHVDVAGSTIPYPASGLVNVLLIRSEDGVIIASKKFVYIKTGSIIKLKNPDEVNDWAYNNARNADTVKYETDKFVSSFSGHKTMKVSSKYDGTTLASSTVRVFGGHDCLNHPSPHLCRKD